jgi:hypothetical protein
VGLRPVVFGPCTLWRTWGTRPVSFELVKGANVTQSYCLSFQQWRKSVRVWLTPITLKVRVCLE